MPTISIANTSVYQDDVGNPTDGAKLLIDLQTVFNEVNNKETRLTNLESNAETIGGLKSFSTGIRTDNIGPYTTNGNILLTGAPVIAFSTDPGTLTEGLVWINSTSHHLKAYLNGAIVDITAQLGQYPLRYRGSAPPIWASTTTLTVAYIHERDSANAVNIDTASSSTLNCATTGRNGLDTGTLANNTFYYLYAVTDGTNVGVMASTVNEYVTGTISNSNFAYTAKRQLPFAFLTDGSAHIINFTVANWGANPTIWYNVNGPGYGGSGYTAGDNAALSNGSATTFTDVALGSFVPPISNLAWLGWILNGTGSGYIRTRGSSLNGMALSPTSGATGIIPITTDGSQKVQYEVLTTAGLYIGILGYVVTAAI